MGTFTIAKFSILLLKIKVWRSSARTWPTRTRSCPYNCAHGLPRESPCSQGFIDPHILASRTGEYDSLILLSVVLMRQVPYGSQGVVVNNCTDLQGVPKLLGIATPRFSNIMHVHDYCMTLWYFSISTLWIVFTVVLAYPVFQLRLS